MLANKFKPLSSESWLQSLAIEDDFTMLLQHVSGRVSLGPFEFLPNIPVNPIRNML